MELVPDSNMADQQNALIAFTGGLTMRYMMLIYSNQQEASNHDRRERNYSAHWQLIDEAKRRGVFVAAEPLASSTSATTIRVENGKGIITDGPFAETKEQLAGYYIFDCKDLDEAIEWASRLPRACTGPGGIEIRPMPGLPAPPDTGRN